MDRGRQLLLKDGLLDKEEHVRQQNEQETTKEKIEKLSLILIDEQ